MEHERRAAIQAELAKKESEAEAAFSATSDKMIKASQEQHTAAYQKTKQQERLGEAIELPSDLLEEEAEENIPDYIQELAKKKRTKEEMQPGILGKSEKEVRKYGKRLAKAERKRQKELKQIAAIQKKIDAMPKKEESDDLKEWMNG